MILISAGIDDFATEKQLSDGWAYFVIETILSDEFSIQSNELLDGIALDSFHGKHYKKRFKNKYLDFLKLCREFSEKSNISLIATILQNKEWKNQYIPFTQRLIKNIFNNNNIINSELILSAQKLSGPLFVLQNLTKSLSSEHEIQILVDSEKVTEKFDELEVEVSNSIGSTSITGKQLLKIVYNGYRKIKFPNSPTLIDNGISVRPDENTFLIQAADIIGNFSLSYIKKNLGQESKTIDDKAELFSKVFGDKFDNKDFRKDFEISESGELELKINGQVTMMFGRFSDY